MNRRTFIASLATGIAVAPTVKLEPGAPRPGRRVVVDLFRPVQQFDVVRETEVAFEGVEPGRTTVAAFMAGAGEARLQFPGRVLFLGRCPPPVLPADHVLMISFYAPDRSLDCLWGSWCMSSKKVFDSRAGRC